jgi:hypothetical protein
MTRNAEERRAMPTRTAKPAFRPTEPSEMAVNRMKPKRHTTDSMMTMRTIPSMRVLIGSRRRRLFDRPSPRARDDWEFHPWASS